MIIVADTTPISELTKVGYLDLLPTMFGEVIIPEAVFNELKVGRHPAAVIVSELSWLKVLTLNNSQQVKELQEKFNLDLGESEAIVLAEEIGAQQLLIDEKAARRVATEKKLPLIGTMGILLLAKRRGFVSSVKDILDEMQKQGTRISNRLYLQVLTLADELKK